MSFDAIAPWYRTLERIAFGDDLQRCRIACLSEIAAPRRALIVGEGDGRFLAELLRLHPEAEVDCIDASERMLQLARQRIDEEFSDGVGRTRFRKQDVTSWSPPEREYDLVVTLFVLDCFPASELTGIIQKLARAATNDATWLLADFCMPPRGIPRLRARAWLAAMYVFFRITARIPATELIDPTPLMQFQRFSLARQHLFRAGLLKS
ncbi:MAG: class I SAM-dependent methyltransferase, partial [Verrucomicrobiota bacterium]|nr:class I SAM-dependent methyltransferase [Verrucomicrobiota bacterium]